MAVGQIYEFNFFIVDKKKRSAIISIPMGVEGEGDEPGIEELVDIAEALELILDPLTGGDIRSCSVSVPLAIFSANTPDSGSDVEEGALFSFTAEGTSKHKIMRLPTFREALLKSDSEADYTPVDLEAPEVENLLDAIDAGIVVGPELDEITARLVDSEGRILDGVWSAEEDFRRRKKRR